MSVFCNICIDDSDLDNILSKLLTLKTKIADWADYNKTQGNLNGQPGINSHLCLGVNLGDNVIESQVAITLTDEHEDLVNELIALLDQAFAESE